MYYWRTCGSEGHAVVEVMLFMRICYGRICLLGEHVLQADISCRKPCIMGGGAYLMRGYVL